MAEAVEVTLARLEERIKTLSDEVRHVHEEVSDLKARQSLEGCFLGHARHRRCRRNAWTPVCGMDEIMAIARANMNNQVSKPPMKRPKSKMAAFDEFRKKERQGFHHSADPRRPMNAESIKPKTSKL